jgi:very-short-patch-repair endonuclease
MGSAILEDREGRAARQETFAGKDRRGGTHIRKQHAVGTYIVDFFCAKSKLVIEIDGDSHFDPDQEKYDRERTEWLNEQKNYRVIRFINDEVHHNLEAVLEKILEVLQTPT